jgi:hypothetical protein
LSRRHFLRTAAGAAGVVLGSGLLIPGSARAGERGSDPRPIPGGIQPLGEGTEVFHLFLPGHGNELSTITDFQGVLAAAHITGAGTAKMNGKTRRLAFDADMRFMEGLYIGRDGRRHLGAFAFI